MEKHRRNNRILHSTIPLFPAKKEKKSEKISVDE
jgi:hypothetical protein